MTTARGTPHAHTCPGGCGRELVDAVFACLDCTGALPAPLRHDISATWLEQDWPAHSRAVTDGLHFFSALHEIRRRRAYLPPPNTDTAPQGTP